MPQGDGTGPLGLGPTTERAAGFYAGSGMPGLTAPRLGRGHGGGCRGRSAGRGRRRWYPVSGFTGGSPFGQGWASADRPWPDASYSPAPLAGMTRQQEIDALKDQAEYLDDILDGLRRRIEELQPQDAKV